MSINIVNDIKNIILDYIKENYNNYLNNNKILLIKSENLKNIIEQLYTNNIKEIKAEIRSNLKNKYKENYPNLSVENTILDIFQDKEFNINKLTDEINIIQKKNHKSVEISIINNSLNLNISIVENYIVINSTNTNNIDDDIYKIINNYKFLYSINNKILEEYENTEKINIIKSEINNKDRVEIGLYYLKKNCDLT